MRRTIRVIVAAAALALIGPTAALLPAVAAADNGRPDSTAVYLVVLREAPAASYQGGIGSYVATAPAPGQRFDMRGGAVVAYRSHLAAEQQRVLDEIGDPQRLYSYSTALNGFAVSLTAEQVKLLHVDPRVLLVQPDSRVAVDAASTSARASAAGRPPPPDGAFGALWDQVGGPQRAGRGVVVGVIDTGVSPDNPSLAGIPLNAADRARTYPGFTGTCERGVEWRAGTCSSKVLAARSFVRGFGRANVATSDYLSPRDATGHGTGVAAVAAGNAGVDTHIGRQHFGHISGVAPAAGLSIYKACWTAPDPSRDGCDVADAVRAIDQAVADGVDVISYSIGDSAASLDDAVQLAFLNAAAANVFVAAPAGNGGPAAGTVQHPAPWVTTTGANTQQVFQGGVRLGSGPTLIGAMLSDDHVGPAPLVYAGDVPAGGVTPRRSALCYPGSLDAQRVDGAIVVCDRGVTARVSKSAAVAQAGGLAMVLVNLTPGSVDADVHRVPTVQLDAAAGARIKDYVSHEGTDATATVVPGATNHPTVPMVADFSGRGPTKVLGGDVLKPDLTAPGVSVVSAAAPRVGSVEPGSEPLWNVTSGTSIATPQVAGLAAVVRAARPAWTPAQTKSAMMTTARPLPGGDDPLSRGAGELDAAAVLDPGLVYSVGVDEWSALLRGQGVDIDGLSLDRPTPEAAQRPAADLNGASISIGDLVGRQTISRSVTNVGSLTKRYTAEVTGLRGITSLVTPQTLTVHPGGTAEFTVTFSAASSAGYDAFSTGSLVWRSASGETVASPVAIRPELASTPAEVTGSGRAGTATVRALAGVTGTIHVVTSGLVGATPVPLALSAGSFDPDHPATSPATAAQTLDVPPASRAARFQVAPVRAGPRRSTDDVDLYVYRGGVLVASATGAAADETVTLTKPPAGHYTVYVTAHATVAGLAHVTCTSWVLPGGTSDNLRLAPHYAGVDGGERFSVAASWRGLEPSRRWWGILGYRGLPEVTYLTIS